MEGVELEDITQTEHQIDPEGPQDNVFTGLKNQTDLIRKTLYI